MQAQAALVPRWHDICAESELVENSGICALVEDQQIAIFTVITQESRQLYAVSNWDPIGKANVIYRGIIGSVGDATVVASPLYKEHYCLETGRCIEKDEVSLLTFGIQLRDGRILVAV